MSRSRNLKPGFFKNELLVEQPFEYRLLFAGLWTLADRDGLLEDRPTRIKMELFPADNVDVNAGLDALQEAGFILRYEAEGKRCIAVLAWAKHQNPHHKEVESVLPKPPCMEQKPWAQASCMDGESGSCDPSISNKTGASTGKVEATPPMEGASTVLIPDSLNLIPDSLPKKPAPSKKRSASDSAVELQTWLDSLEGKDAIPADDPIFEYAEKSNIPLDYLELSWRAFVRDMRERKTRKKDWRAHYRNAVRGHWYKLWWFDKDGVCQLTTSGVQERRNAA